MSSNVIEWARVKFREIVAPEVKHFPVKSLHEGMLVRGCMSRWQMSVARNDEPDWAKDFREDNYITAVDDIYMLLSKSGDKWMTLTPNDGVQCLSAWQFHSIDSIPYSRTEEEMIEDFNEYDHQWLVPGLDYEEAS